MAKINLTPSIAENVILEIIAGIDINDIDLRKKLGLDKLLAATLSAEEKRRSREGNAAERRAIEDAKLNELQIKAQQKKDFAEFQSAQKGQEADAALQRDLQRTEERQVAKAQGAVRAQAVTQAAEAASPASILNLQREQDAIKAISTGKVLNATQLAAEHTGLLVPAANQAEIKQRLESLVTARTTQAKTVIQAEAARKGATQFVINPFLDLTDQVNVLTPSGKINTAGKNLVGEITEAQRSVVGTTTQLEQNGLRTIISKTGEVRVLPPVGAPKRVADVVTKVTPEISKGLELLASGEKGAGKATIETALNVLKAGPGRSPLVTGGLIGGALLLPSIIRAIRGGEDKQQQLSPQAQIQLLQALAQLKQNESLTQSLAQSRQASAAKNLAQADLLRLQALQATGGSGQPLL